MTVGEDSWVTLAAANAYMATRPQADGYWNTLTDAGKEAFLIAAWRDLAYCGDFDLLPTTPDDRMEAAQCEQALMLLRQGDDLDRRLDLIEQGVVVAGLVKEEYDAALRGRVVVAVRARAYLRPYDRSRRAQFFTSISRED